MRTAGRPIIPPPFLVPDPEPEEAKVDLATETPVERTQRKRREYTQTYRTKHPERVAAQIAKWRKSHPFHWKKYLEKTRLKTNENIRKRRASRKSIIDNIKLGKGCFLCGYRENSMALDFDHIDPKTKRFNIAAGYWRPWEQLMAEIGRCRLLCANCHRVETYRQKHSSNHDRNTIGGTSAFYHP